jgi:hypothetical protein
MPDLCGGMVDKQVSLLARRQKGTARTGQPEYNWQNMTASRGLSGKDY